MKPNIFEPGLRSRFFAIGERTIFYFTLCSIMTFFMTAHADELDDYITSQMHEKNITGLSLAIIQSGKIIKEKGYGFTDQSGKTLVTCATLFQAGSISKSVSAFGALHLVEQGRLILDADVNTQLHTWKIPENEFTKNKKVTLRGILSHNAGLNVHGFPGYATDAVMPTLLNVLDGVKPANTPAIHADIVPGSEWRYSGGGYTVMQQMIIDATGKSFPEFMHETVLTPLGMTNSTYEQPLPQDIAISAASGYYSNGRAVSGRWHVYPEMAAAGLWTTASDLAHFAIGVQQAFTGETDSVLSQSMAHQMLTEQVNNDGLGVFLTGHKEMLRFWHDGRNAGFDGFMIASANLGNGAVILINANDNSGTLKNIIKFIVKKYHW